MKQLHGDQVLRDEIFYFLVGVRNCTHLFAPDSHRVEKIEQHGLLLPAGPVQRLIQLTFPSKDDVQSARAMENEQEQIYVSILFTEAGRKKIHLMTERNKGKDVSMYFGNKLIWKDVYLPESIDSPDIQITMPDEATMREVINCYTKGQRPK